MKKSDYSRLRLFTWLELKRLTGDRGFWLVGLVAFPILVPLVLVGVTSLSMILSSDSEISDESDTDSGDLYVAVQYSGDKVPVDLPPIAREVDSVPDNEIDTWVLEVHPILADVHFDGAGVTVQLFLNHRLPASGFALGDRFANSLAENLYSQTLASVGMDPEQARSAFLPVEIVRTTVQRQMTIQTFMAIILWFMVPCASFMIVERIGTTSIMTDNDRGSLWPVATSPTGRATWLCSRYCALSICASFVVMYYAVLSHTWISLYAWIVDGLIDAGMLDLLSPEVARGVSRYTVDFVSAWRDFGNLGYVAWVAVALLHVIALTGVVLYISISSSSVRRANLFSSLLFLGLASLPIVFNGPVAHGLSPAFLAFLPVVSVVASATEISLGSPNGGVFPAIATSTAFIVLALYVSLRRLTPKRLARMV